MTADFPRGGGIDLTPLELKRINQQADQDAEKEIHSSTKKRRTLKAQKTEPKTRILPNTLNYKKLSVGMMLLGVVKDINEIDVTVALPNQLLGFVSCLQISQWLSGRIEEEEDFDLHDFLNVGQVVSAKIVSLGDDDKRRIDLSLRPESIYEHFDFSQVQKGTRLTGQIESIEERGYIIDFNGTSKGFLKLGSDQFSVGKLVTVFAAENGGKSIFRVKLNAEEKLLAPSFDMLLPNVLVEGIVKFIHERGLVLNINGFDATVDVFNLPKPNFEDILDNFSPGESLVGRILYVNADEKTCSVTLKPSLVDFKEYEPEYCIGDTIEGVILRVDQGLGVLIECNETIGYCHVSRLSDDHVSKIEKAFKPGTRHTFRVIDLDPCSSLLQLSAQSSVLAQRFISYENIKAGTVHKVQLIKITPKGLLLKISDTVKGLAPTTHLTEVATKNPFAKYTLNQTLKARVLNVHPKEKLIFFTLKKSLVYSELPCLTNVLDAKIGMWTHGFITAMKDFGCFVMFYNKIVALMHKSEIIGDLVVGQVVECRVLSVDANGKMQVSMKSSTLLKAPESSRSSRIKNIEDVEPDMEVVGNVCNITDHGCFVKLSNKLTARVKIAEMSNDFVKDWKSLVKVGQKVEGRILSKDERGRIEMTLKKKESLSESEEESEESSDEQSSPEGSSKEDSDSESVEESVEPVPLVSEFIWGNSKPEVKSEVSEEESRNEKIDEKVVAAAEKSLMHDSAPENSQDFDRVLIGTPNNSFIWIKYMAFYLKQGSVEKAREIAERALKTISYREEIEKKNIWIALLNLENAFGTEESLEKVFNRAITYNDSKAMHMQLAKILQESSKQEKAHEVYLKAIKKFRMSCKVWQFYVTFLLNCKKPFQKEFTQGLEAMPNHKKVKFLLKIAQLEFKQGDPERGRTIFEKIMVTWPRRIDAWSVYLDMEEKIGQIDRIRRLYERIVHQKLSAKKMKFFFKRYLAFEKRNEDGDAIEHVKQLAREFVESQ